jgi:L-asparagine oxygenase
VGGRAAQDGRTELVGGDLRPDFLSSACLQADPRVTSHVLTAAQLASGCRPAERALLRQPLWTAGAVAPSPAGGDAESLGRYPVSVLYGADDDPFIIFDRALMRGVDDSAAGLLSQVASLYRRERSGYALRTGDVFILDNQRAIHGTSPNARRLDGAGLHIIRSFVTRDLNRSRHARPGDSRTISAAFC